MSNIYLVEEKSYGISKKNRKSISNESCRQQECGGTRCKSCLMNGTINDFLELKDKECNDLKNSIIIELKNKYKRPSTDSFIELSQYNNFIYNKADEIIIWMICTKIIKTYRL